MTANRTVVVVAKTPLPGLVKTRLCPPLSPEQAATLAAAALRDTFHAVRAVPDIRRVLTLDGEPGDWVPRDFDVVAQPPGTLDERLAAAFAETTGPTVLIGMDTPQVQPTDLELALAILERGTDAVVGPASDGGYWLLGLRVPDPGAVRGVPMSVADTGAAQIAQLGARGLTTQLVREMQDVDHFADAIAVAATTPTSQFADAVRALDPPLVTATPR
jgi:rSAM/selenodomain-associated transferase 1